MVNLLFNYELIMNLNMLIKKSTKSLFFFFQKNLKLIIYLLFLILKYIKILMINEIYK